MIFNIRWRRIPGVGCGIVSIMVSLWLFGKHEITENYTIRCDAADNH